MITSTTAHRFPISVMAAATTGLTGALLAAGLTGVHAGPAPHDSPPAVVRPTADPTPRQLERPCFITPPRWNEALDGPLPRCYTRLP